MQAIATGAGAFSLNFYHSVILIHILTPLVISSLTLLEMDLINESYSL